MFKPADERRGDPARNFGEVASRVKIVPAELKTMEKFAAVCRHAATDDTPLRSWSRDAGAKWFLFSVPLYLGGSYEISGPIGRAAAGS